MSVSRPPGSHPHDPTTGAPGSDPRPLEPWAVALEDAENPDHPEHRDALAQVAALLRNLPEPDSDPQRSERLLARIAEQRARPRILRGAFRLRRVAGGLGSRGGALALAAGVAGLLALPVFTGSLSLPALLGGEAPPSHIVIRDPAADGRLVAAADGRLVRAADGRATPAFAGLRPVFPRRAQSSNLPLESAKLGLVGFAPQGEVGPHYASQRPAPSGWSHLRAEDALARRLDQQLNQLQLDPSAFAERLTRVRDRDRFIARLTERAAQRGDAPEIALRVRRSDHPLAKQIGGQLLRATLVHHISGR